MLRSVTKGFVLGAILIANLMLPLPACATTPIRINGTGSGLHMMKPLLEAYNKTHPEAHFEMDKALGSSGSIKALLANVLDIAVSSRPLKPKEAQAGARVSPYGQTPLALVTHKDVTVTELTTQELVNIYAGKTLNWPDGNPIRIILRPQEDSDTKILSQLSPEMNTAMISAQLRPGMTIAVTDPESIAAIAKTPGAIGTSGLTGVIVEQLPVNVIRLNGVEPTPNALTTHSFPLSKPLDIVTLHTLSEAAKQFLTFVYSPEGRTIAEAAGVEVTAGEKSPW